MPFIIGMDEAGYGPNLGPLVVTACVWEVPGPPARADFWEAFGDVAGPTAAGDGSRLHIADSKAVYSPAHGLAALEAGVLCAVQLLSASPRTNAELHQSLHIPKDSTGDFQRSAADAPLSLPFAASPEHIDDISKRWRQSCESSGYRLRAIRTVAISPKLFNALVDQLDNKANVLSHVSLALLRQVWEPETDSPTLVLADKHGGRNRYDRLLAEVLDGQMIFRLEEGRDISRYRVGDTDLRFQTKGEQHFPVALASMVSKYVRELSMEQFNRFWQEHVPDLKPTKGYPVDAKRFKADIAAAQSRLGIDDDVLWRKR